MTIVITGTGGVGKSALTLAYVSHHFVSEYGTYVSPYSPPPCVGR